MVIDANSIAIVLATSFISGAATAIVASISDNKKEKKRIAERDQDHLKMDLKDMKIKLYEIEKELDSWKAKYYNTLQELIQVKSELEETLTRLNIISDFKIDPESY